MEPPVIVIHGGAWDIPKELTERSLEGVNAAARKGYSVLRSGGSAMDAVVGAVSEMEDNTAFDAGHGAVLNLKREVELDAIVIDGQTLDSGAVCSLQDCAHPVQLARLVMEKTSHCLLSGQGANDFMEQQGIGRVPQTDLVTPEARLEWERYVKFSATVNSLFSPRTDSLPPRSGCDTVGAIAVDANGNVASATSTGGITAKLPGRVGDTPIIGAGAYADNNVGAVSSTGHGEAIMKVCLARRVGELMERGETAQRAAEQALQFMKDRVGGAGGVVVLSADSRSASRVGRHFTTSRMAWAAVEHDVLSWGIDPEQTMNTKL